MNFLKVSLVISLGLGLSWGANQMVPSVGVLSVAQAADEKATESVVADPDQEEVDAQLERVQKILESDEELKDFVPSEPLSADVAIEYPSDI